MDVLNLEETEALSVLNALIEQEAMDFDDAVEQIDELFGEIKGLVGKLNKYRNRDKRIETLRGNIDRHAGKLRTKGILSYDDHKARAQHATLDRIYHDSSLPKADYEKHSGIIKDQDGALGKREKLMSRAARWDKIGGQMQAKDGKSRPPKVRHLSGMREAAEQLAEAKKYIVTGRSNNVVGEHDDLRKAQRHADNEESESGYIHLVHQVVDHPKRPNTHKVVKTWEQNHGHPGGSYWESRKPEENDEFTYPKKSVKESVDFDAELLLQFHEAADQIEQAVLEENADLDQIEAELNESDLAEGDLMRKFAKWFTGSARRDRLVSKIQSKQNKNTALANDAYAKALKRWKEIDKNIDRWDREIRTPYNALQDAANRAHRAAVDSNHQISDKWNKAREAKQPFKDAIKSLLPPGTEHPMDSYPDSSNEHSKRYLALSARGSDLQSRQATVERSPYIKHKKYLSGKVTKQVNEEIQPATSRSVVKRYAELGAELNPDRNKYNRFDQISEANGALEKMITEQVALGFGRDQILGKLIAEGADGNKVRAVRQKIDAMYNKKNRGNA